MFSVLTSLGSAASKRDPGHLRASAPLPVRAAALLTGGTSLTCCAAALLLSLTFELYCRFALLLCRRVALKAADPETDALEECLLVMKPCDPADPTNDDECLDEEVLRVSGAPALARRVWSRPTVGALEWRMCPIARLRTS